MPSTTSSALLFVGGLAVSSAVLYTEIPSHQNYLWSQFKTSYNKNYPTPTEDNSRFKTFLANLKIVDERNDAESRAGGSAKHGITRFTDLTQSEFTSMYLQAKPEKTHPNLNATLASQPILASASINWAGKFTTPVKNQGYCGSCWAFSATEQIESDAMRTLNSDFILSPEQIVQCANVAQGCGGGWTEAAYKYVTNSGGLELESNYPYTSGNGVTGKCQKAPAPVVTVTGYTTVEGESNMSNYMLSTGPLSVCLDASSWNSYSGGVMKVCGQSVDHCVQAVGVNTDPSTGYWIVRNSWGTDWGEDGYIRLAYGQNTCDITNDPTWTTVKLV